MAIADGFGGVEGAAAVEDGEPGEESLFFGGEQVVAPVDRRAEGLLACGQVAWAAGEMTSTTRDLDTFIVALSTGKLLKPAQQKELSKTTDVSPNYGLGLGVQTLPCGTKVWGHGGGIPGYSTELLSTPDTKKRLELSVTSAPTPGDPNAPYLKILNEVFC